MTPLYKSLYWGHSALCTGLPVATTSVQCSETLGVFNAYKTLFGRDNEALIISKYPYYPLLSPELVGGIDNKDHKIPNTARIINVKLLICKVLL